MVHKGQKSRADSLALTEILREQDEAQTGLKCPPPCPLDLYKKDESLKGRSISPWAYVQRKMPEHFPSTFYEAHCLCEGCILYNDEDELYESHSHNSAPVVQNRVFLKRELCDSSNGDGRRYRLKPVNVNVTVACTCVRPLY
ncbi:hypothetical protein WMY93_023953 [Mugilogobius chulae]|uniref:Interleukin 17C n=1 Tax=Mugilogobius chulae TaxID=88201 RepID=A0AAW0NGT0_9GOBI